MAVPRSSAHAHLQGRLTPVYAASYSRRLTPVYTAISLFNDLYSRRVTPIYTPVSLFNDLYSHRPMPVYAVTNIPASALHTDWEPFLGGRHGENGHLQGLKVRA